MSIKNIAVYQGNSWQTEPFGADAANVTVTGGAQGDIMYVGGSASSPVLSYTSQVKLANLTGLTGNVQDQIDAIGTSGPTPNVLTPSTSTVSLSTSTLTQNITITQTGDATLNVFSLDTDVATVALVSGNTYRITAVGNGSTNIVVIAPSTSNYSAASAMIDVNVSLVAATLEDNDWSTISSVSAAGTADTYWDVGDKKKIILNGTVGTLSLSNQEVYVYILGFNHNNSVQGTGISFGGFKTSSGTDICLVDANYSSTNTTGSKWFNMNHQRSSASQYGHNYGGWKGCDMRYDILGSTNVAPSEYNTGSTYITTSRYGNDPTSTCATSPVANTLMAALPASLRAVMKPITKYTDNKGNSSNTSTNVTSSIDYLPLLAQFEIFGSRSYANQYQQNKQAQYTYFANGNSKIKYKHDATSTAAGWWGRSPYYNYANFFCYVGTDGGANNYASRRSRGVAVVLVV